MLIQLIVTFFLILSVYLINLLYIYPKKQISKYKQLFESKGYRVYQFPYKAFTYPIIQTIYKDSAKGDAFYSYKNIFCNYDVLLGNQLHHPSISLFNPELRKQFAKVERDQVYQKLQSIAIQQVRFIGQGLVFSQGDQWKRRRRIMGALFTFDFIKDNIFGIEGIWMKNIQKIELNCKKISQNGQQIFQYELGEMASTIFSQVVISLFFGLKILQQNINGVPIGKFIMQLANDANMQAKGLLPLLIGVKYLDWGLTKKHRQINERLRLFNNWINNFINKQITSQKKMKGESFQNVNKNILSIHLKSQLNKYNNSKNFQKTLISNSLKKQQNLYDKQELISELKNFAIAGTDTSVSYFRMMVYYISQNSQIQNKLRQQIKQIQNKTLTFQNLKKLKYLQAIQKQTTRMYGPINFNFPRRVLKDHYIDGIPIRKQTIIQYHTICTHYNPEYYDQPHKFKPERWLKQQQDQKNMALLVGFGLGPRNCIGQHLASVQSKIALVKFYQRYSSVKICNDKINFKWKFFYKPDNFNVRVQLQNKNI